MYLTADVARRLWRWLSRGAPGGSSGSPGAGRLVPVLVSVLVVIGASAGAVLTAAGGRPAGTAGPDRPVPSIRPAPAHSAAPVVPLLGGDTEAGRA